MTSYEREDAAHGYEKAVDAHPEDYAWSEWSVYSEYSIGEYEGNQFIYAPMTDPVRQLRTPPVGERRRYRPLSRPTAALFLEFARWPETEGMDRKPLGSKKNAAAAREWAEIHGVLGLDSSHGFAVFSKAPHAAMRFLGTYAIRQRTRNEGYGGFKETAEAFAKEAWLANLTLRLYEAATNPEGSDSDTIAAYMPGREIMGMPGERALHADTPESARRWALDVVEEVVEDRMRGRVWPISVRDYNAHGGYVGHKQGWAFDSLLGAMWLQMMWLMLAARRCEWCGTLLDIDSEQALDSAADSIPGGKRKPRSDMRFCDNNGHCRGKWNYHRGIGNSSKAARKKRRKSGDSDAT